MEIIVLVSVFGLIIGSFLNALIYRTKVGESVARGRSKCTTCKKELTWLELIPLLSYVVQRGVCRGCKEKIHWQYPAVEFITATAFVLVFLFYRQQLPLLEGVALVMRDWFFVSALLVIFVLDIRWQIIPDRITLPAIGMGIGFTMVVLFVQQLSAADNMLLLVWDQVVNSIIAMVVGGGFFLIQFVVSRGQWIGGGDIRLGVLMGIILGWPNIVVAIMIAYVIGAVFAISLVVARKKEWSSKIPFGTFLSVATVIVLYKGTHIIDWYMNLL